MRAIVPPCSTYENTVNVEPRIWLKNAREVNDRAGRVRKEVVHAGLDRGTHGGGEKKAGGKKQNKLLVCRGES